MIFKLCLVLFLTSNLVLSHSSNDILKTEVPKSNSNSTKVKTESIKNFEKIISSKLRIIKNDELMIPIVQAEVDSWTFIENSMSDSEQVEKISLSINKKLQPALKIIKDICGFLTNKEYKGQFFDSIVNPCPHNDKIDIRINHFYNDIYHNNNFSGEVDILNDRNLIFHNYLVENVKKAGQVWKSYRQYFLSTSDQAKIENCQNMPEILHFSRLYTNSIHNKRLLILVDVTSEQMEINRAIAKTLISSLSQSDSVAVILIANKAIPFKVTSSTCSSKNTAMVLATLSIKSKIYDFLDRVNRTTGIAKHALGFQAAFEVLDNLYKESNNEQVLPIIFVYISEGVILPGSSDARNVLAEMAIGQSKLPYPVPVNTIAVIVNNRQIQYQTQFLQDITLQNYNKYNLNTSNWWNKKTDRSPTGQMIVVNRTMENLHQLPLIFTTDLFKNKNFINNQLEIHLPYYDTDLSNDFVISVTKTCEQRGVFGIDLILNYLIEDVLYSNTNDSYKFLLNWKGYAIAHSQYYYYPRLVTLKQNFHPIHITLLEKSKGFNQTTWQIIQNQANGSINVNGFSYTWNQINELLIVGLVTKINEQRPNILHKIKTHHQQSGDQSKHLTDLVYHRLDLSFNSINICQYYKHSVTFDAISLHLSSKAFKSPYAHLSRGNEENVDEKQMIQNFMAFLRDTKNFFANPGLVEGVVRQEVSGLYQIMDLYKKKHADSELKKYIIRRYVAGVNGALQIFPGCSLDENFDSSRRPWFVKALESKGKLAITEPYLDAAGAGFIVSVSYAVYEKRYSPNNRVDYQQPIAVVSLDFTRGYFYKMLIDSLPICNYDDVKCFLMDDKGYLIAHRNVLEPTNEPFRQPEHITHKESHVANDILMQRKFVEKIACNNYLNGTSKRFFQFNTTINEVITNYANVEKTKYQLVSLKNTNIFVGIINSSSETSGAFCPCSTIDHRCLNCFRMEQNECECPCECRLDIDSEFDTCSSKNQLQQLDGLNEICQQQIEYTNNYRQAIFKENIDTCNLFNCDMFNEKEDCLGVVGCVWCHTNDDETQLSIPFCAIEATCYNGIFGSLGDGYGNIVIDPIMNYNLLPPTYSIILPVIIGVIVLLFLVVGFAMYCYRINYDNNGFGEHLYIDNGSMDNNCIGMMQMSRFDYDEGPPIDEQMGSNLNQSLLNSNENAIISSIQSPYRVSTNYRHPNYTDSSDHGYSTMDTNANANGHSSSLSNHQNKRFSLSDTASLDTSVSSPHHTQSYELPLPSKSFSKNSPTFFPSSDQTILSPKKLSSSPNQVIAEVTVHRLMD